MPVNRDLRALLRDREPAELADLITRTVHIGQSFLNGTVREGRVLQYAEPGELIKRFSGDLPEDGLSDAELLQLLEDVASWSVSQADERYLAFPDTGDSVANVLAGVLAAMLNQNMIAFDRSAPAGSVIEAQLIGWLRDLIGYRTTPLQGYAGLASVGGMWTSGGNMSNHIAIAAAVAATHPQVRQQGLSSLSKRPVIVLARGVEHFSYRAAAQVLGMGTDSVLWADSSTDYTTDVDSVRALVTNPPEGTAPVMVVGVAGNCRTTGIDDLSALGALCRESEVWYHVDACHGGSLLFSDRLRGRLSGIETADSVSLDPHKGLFVGYPSSYVLFKDPASLAGFSRYPSQVDDPDVLDLGLITPFYGSRGFDSLRLWALLRHIGRAGVAELVEARQETFEKMTDLLDDTGLFVRFGPAEFYRCAFVFCPPEARTQLADLATDQSRKGALRQIVSDCTADFCDLLYRSGRVVFDLFSLADLGDTLGLGTSGKYQVMGMCVGHPRIADATIDTIRTDLLDAANRIRPIMLNRLAELAESDATSTTPKNPSSPLGPAGW